MVSTKFFTSFLGRAISHNITEAFKEVLTPLNMKSILQISMDGSNVNHKFFKVLKAELESEHGPEILNVGTCGFHISNFKAAM